MDRDPDSGGSWVPPENRPDGKPDRPRRLRDGDFRRKQPFFFFDDDDDDDRIIAVPAEPRKAPEPEEDAPEQAVPPPPPDPRGPKFVPARGASVGARYTVGEPLPEGVPFVTLDWSRYELPEPPPGLVYARVGGDVLLIDPATRAVERRVVPSELKTTETAGEPG